MSASQAPLYLLICVIVGIVGIAMQASYTFVILCTYLCVCFELV